MTTFASTVAAPTSIRPAPAAPLGDAASLADAEIAVCPVGRLTRGRGVAALLPDGRQVAVYLVDDEVYALCNIDPVARAAVMSRGLVGPDRQAGLRARGRPRAGRSDAGDHGVPGPGRGRRHGGRLDRRRCPPSPPRLRLHF